MKNKIVLLSATLAVLAMLSIAAARRWDRTRTPEIPVDTQPAWGAAMSFLEKKDFRSARDNFTRWIAAARAGGIRSPEAHYNLATAHWGLKESGAAASEILNSLLLSQSFSQIARAKTVLAGMQRELGVSDSVLHENHFKARVWLTDNALSILVTTALWSLLLACFWVWRKRPQWKREQWGQLAAIAVGVLSLLALAGTGIACRDWRGGYGVLQAEEGAVSLFPDPRLDAQEKLLDLPSGTLVHSSGETQNGFFRIDSPIVAWVQTTQLKLSPP